MTTSQTRVSIITGAGKGIGRAVAIALARRGEIVIANARTSADLEGLAAEIEGFGGQCLVVQGDVARQETATELADTARSAFGHCDLLINAAGVQPRVNEIEALSLEDWHRTIDINVTGTFLTCRALLPMMKAAGRGRIINLASGLAVHVQPGQAAYSAAKAAVVQFSAVLAAEAAPHGVSVVSAHPGIVDTAIVQQNLTDDRPGVARDMIVRLENLKREGFLITPEQSARFFVWLASADVEPGGFIRIDDPDVKRNVERFWQAA